jgi:peptide-methionine (R)-S-oxide reductase
MIELLVHSASTPVVNADHQQPDPWRKIMYRRTLLKGIAGGALLSACGGIVTVNTLFAGEGMSIEVWSVAKGAFIMIVKVVKTEAEWRAQLTPEQYYVAREQGTEQAFSGEYDKFYQKGVYQCIGCGQDLFLSEHKYDSQSGWPSFYQPVAKENVGISKDRSWLMVRNEVHCSRCDSHLGHVFEDGPEPTGLRYCINSVSLTFVAA